MSTQVERRQIEWRRAKVLELSSQGHSQREIADIIHVGIGTINMAKIENDESMSQLFRQFMDLITPGSNIIGEFSRLKI